MNSKLGARLDRRTILGAGAAIGALQEQYLISCIMLDGIEVHRIDLDGLSESSRNSEAPASRR